MKRLTTRELTLAALFIAVTAVLSQIVVPMPLVPFNLAVLAVFLCGAMQRKEAALLSQLGYLLLGGMGVPVFAQFSGGPSVLLGVTGGYLMAYPVMAWMVAALTEKWARKNWKKRLAAMLLAMLPLYLLGTAWFALYLGQSFAEAARAACLPYIPFDTAKAVTAAYLSVLVENRVPGKAAA